ncbi:MAG: hypothetical protein M5U26_15330 [Planctomycetota bacterium]|nr:hypothetical protein [Planctomycetota bacterium]
MTAKLIPVLLGALCCAAGLAAEDTILYVEQDYSIVKQNKAGLDAKDIRQKLYLTKDAVLIEEYAGASAQPTEAYLIDFKKQQIVNLDYSNTVYTSESFDERRERIEERKLKVLRDLDNLIEGKQKEQTRRLYRALLDDERKFKIERPKEEAEKELAGVKAERVQILDESDPKYVPFEAWLHPDDEVPYDNAEVLYLMQIIGPNMAKFLKENKSVFRRLPLELNLNLPVGGSLHTKVVKVESVSARKFKPDLYEIPKGFQPKKLDPAPAQKTAEPATKTEKVPD